MPLPGSVSGNPYSRRRKRIGPGVGVRGPNPTAINFSIEHGRLGQSSLPVFRLDANVQRRKRIGPGVGVRGPHLVPHCPKTYARSFPRVGMVRFAHWHSPPLISALSTDDRDNRPYLCSGLMLKFRGERGLNQGWVSEDKRADQL